MSNTYRLYVMNNFVRSFRSRDDAVDYALSHGYEDYEILDQSDAA